jgi:D-alanyl-D-alanine carboxypeptidase
MNLSAVLLRLTAVALLALASAGARAPAQATAAPDAAATATPTVDPKIESLAKAWLLASQSGKIDRRQLSPWLNATLTPELIGQDAAFLGKLGTLESFSYVGSSTFVLATHPYSGPPDAYYEFLATFAGRKIHFLVGLDTDGKIDDLHLWPHEPPPLTESQLVAALQTEMQRETVAKGFSGAVLLAKDGRPVFARAYGFADRQRNIVNTLSTRFRIGSMNKMFTAVAVLQLVQAGKIGLDDPVGKYLTDYPNKEVASEVTVRELLTHTGGTGDIFGPDFSKHRLALRTLDDYVRLYGNRAPEFPPGERYEYSNYGFILLGKIVERASGQSYYDFVREWVYAPAGMTSTGSAPEDTPVAERSVGYMGGNSNTDTLPYRGTSAGGGYTTIGDLLRFANALSRNVLLPAGYTQLLTTGKVTMPSFPDNPRRYAFGFIDQTVNERRCFGHSGGAPGMSADFEICPGTGYVIAVLANVDPPAADDASRFVMNLLP